MEKMSLLTTWTNERSNLNAQLYISMFIFIHICACDMRQKLNARYTLAVGNKKLTHLALLRAR